MPRKSTNVEAGTVTFDFENENSLVFEISQCSPAIVHRLALHGASQKGGDSYAGTAKAIDGTEINPADYAETQVNGVIQQLYNDDWSTRVAGGGPSITDLATALSEVTGGVLEKCVAGLGETSPEDKKGLRAHPKIAVVLARLKKERAEKKEAQLAEAAKTADAPDLSAFVA